MDHPAISICSGVAGLDLGLRIALSSLRVIAYVEREGPAAAKLVEAVEAGALDAAPVWTDLRTFPCGPFRGRVRGVFGGYPCQGESVAGKQRGVDDPRWLWPSVARMVNELRPEWCFFENVANHANKGFRIIGPDLESMGYDVEAGIFAAEEVGAPHRRERLFILAVAHGERPERGAVNAAGARSGQGSDAERQTPSRSTIGCSDVAHGHGRGREGERRGRLPDRDAAFGDDADRRGGEDASLGDTGRERDERRPDSRGVGAAAREGVGEGVQRERWRDAAGGHGDALVHAAGQPERKSEYATGAESRERPRSDAGRGRADVGKKRGRKRLGRALLDAGIDFEQYPDDPKRSHVGPPWDLCTTDAGLWSILGYAASDDERGKFERPDVWQRLPAGGSGRGMGNPNDAGREGRGLALAGDTDQFPTWKTSASMGDECRQNQCTCAKAVAPSESSEDGQMAGSKPNAGIAQTKRGNSGSEECAKKSSSITAGNAPAVASQRCASSASTTSRVVGGNIETLSATSSRGCAVADSHRDTACFATTATPRASKTAGSARIQQLPDFPPGPSDVDGWRRVIAAGRMDLLPALPESAIRLLVDGLAGRMDQLRAGGNGVVALQAAYAFTILARRFGYFDGSVIA